MHRFLLCPLVLFAATAPLAAQTTPFTKIADTNTAIPQGSGNFVSFSNMLSVDTDGSVGFGENGGEDGIHLWTAGVITRIADLDTPIPGGTGNFNDFSFFGNGIDGGRLAFRGSEFMAPDTFLQNGVYAYSGGNLLKIADKTTPIPGGTGNFTGFTTAYVDGTEYAFLARGDSDQQGIYLSDGTNITRIVDKTMAVPVIGGTYGWSAELGFDEGNLVFWAQVTGGTTPGNIVGGYTPGGGVVTLATTATAVPGVGTPFTGFTSPVDLSGTSLAFCGIHASGSGIYSMGLAGGTITPVATTSTAVPFGTGNFTSFSPPSIYGDEIAFQGHFSGGSGIFLRQGGRTRPIITTNDTLEGKDIIALQMSGNALSDGFFAFRAIFPAGEQALYRLTIADLVDPLAVSNVAKKAALRKTIQRVSQKLKQVRKAGQRAQVKRLVNQLRQLQKRLRQL